MPYTLIFLITLAYGAPIMWILKNRRVASFRTRSPKVIILGFALMLGNAVLSTLWMTRDINTSNPLTYQCDIGIFIAVFFQLGILTVFMLRMWRVYRVFSLYQSFLEHQKQQVQNELSLHDSVQSNTSINTHEERDDVFQSDSIFDQSIVIADEDDGRKQDTEYIKQMSRYQENALIWRILMF
jgi:hypothetical protein